MIGKADIRSSRRIVAELIDAYLTGREQNLWRAQLIRVGIKEHLAMLRNKYSAQIGHCAECGREFPQQDQEQECLSCVRTT